MIVEDDADTAMLERDYLEIAGFSAQIVTDGAAAVSAALSGEYDLILLDLVLPSCSGYEICRRIRDKVKIPILMVSAHGGLADKVRGLGLGADDYITKPFEPEELVARVKAHLRSYDRLLEPSGSAQDAIVAGELRIFTRSRKVYKGAEEIKFPNREFELLKFLAEHPNIVFSREKLVESVWRYGYVGENATVTVHIGRIREKIEEDPNHPKIIETVWGAGYRLNAP